MKVVPNMQSRAARTEGLPELPHDSEKAWGLGVIALNPMLSLRVSMEVLAEDDGWSPRFMERTSD